jgi:hypothetical protein
MRLLCIFFLLVLVESGCVTSSRSTRSDQTTIEKIVHTGKSAGEAFAPSVQWMNSAFISGQHTIQSANRKAGRIIATGSLPLRKPGQAVDVDYALIIELNEGYSRLRFEATNSRQIIEGSPQLVFVAEADMAALQEKAEALSLDYAASLEAWPRDE